MGRRRTALATVVAALAPAPASAAAAAPAAADLGDGYVGWPTLLPGLSVGPTGPPRPMPGCRNLRIGCVDRLVHRLDREWSAENATCDHRAVFSIAYERISRGIRDRLAPHTTSRYRPR